VGYIYIKNEIKVYGWNLVKTIVHAKATM